MTPTSFIPYGRQNITQEDIEEVVSVLKSDFLTQGPAVSDFEKEICSMTSAKYCVAVSNGTAALHLAVLALSLPNESYGITTTNTFVASANCLSYCGLNLKLVDIDLKSYNLDINILKDKICKDTSVVIPVHFAGRPVEMDKLNLILGDKDIRVIEDASHALGSYYNDGTPVGSCKFSDMTTFSFHPVKTITSGEGGAITTNDLALYKKLINLRTHGIEREGLKESHGSWYYQMTELGYNYRMTDIQAALGKTQIKRITDISSKRQILVDRYNSELDNIDWLTLPPSNNNHLITHHLYVVRFDNKLLGISKQRVFDYFKENKIGVQVHYIPIHLQEYYQKKYGFKKGDFPNAEAYYESALSIPLYPSLEKNEQDFVIHTIKKIKESIS